MNDEKMKMVEDFLAGSLDCDNPTAHFLKGRVNKKHEELKSVQERLAQAREMVKKLESEGIGLAGAIRECVEQLSEVLSPPETKPETQE